MEFDVDGRYGYMKQYRKQNTKRVTIDFPLDEYERLKHWCDGNNESFSGCVKRLMRSALDEHERKLASNNRVDVKTGMGDEDDIFSLPPLWSSI